jgi:hypothetical protein
LSSDGLSQAGPPLDSQDRARDHASFRLQQIRREMFRMRQTERGPSPNELKGSIGSPAIILDSI